MRQLHFVERDAQAGTMVLATSDGLEKFEIPIDDALRDAVRSATAPAKAVHATARAATDPRISPREIQMRIRSGETAEELADTYGAELDWVMRFATPVLAERTRMADEARRAKARRSTTDGQTVIFGETVDERFSAHGIDPLSVGWDARRREDAQWIITARWIGGQAERAAEWTFHLSGRTVAPIDDTAADLLSDRPIRPVAVPEPVTPPGLSLAPPLAPGVAAFPAMPDAYTGPLPRSEELFDQDRFAHPSAPSAPPAPPSASAPAPAEASRPRAVAPEPESFDRPLPLFPDHPMTARIPKVTESEEDKAARATIPSWDDILLGVRRKHD